MKERYCKIYVESELSMPLLEDHLAGALSLRREKFTLCGDHLEIDVRRNEDWDPERYEPTWVGFVYSRYYLDIEPTEGADRRWYIQAVGRILEVIWGLGADAVAACDFEDELPANPRRLQV